MKSAILNLIKNLLSSVAIINLVNIMDETKL